MDAVKNYNEDLAYDILLDIAYALEDSNNDDMEGVGGYLEDSLRYEYVTDDDLEDFYIQHVMKQGGANGVACLLAQYDDHYFVHALTGYGNINDNTLFEDLTNTIKDYKKDFESLIK